MSKLEKADILVILQNIFPLFAFAVFGIFILLTTTH